MSLGIIFKPNKDCLMTYLEVLTDTLQTDWRLIATTQGFTQINTYSTHSHSIGNILITNYIESSHTNYIRTAYKIP